MAESQLVHDQQESDTHHRKSMATISSARPKTFSSNELRTRVAEMEEAAGKYKAELKELSRHNADLRAEVEELKRREAERKETGAEIMRPSPFTMLLLPAELIDEVALHLKSTFQWRSLANLNQTCRVIRHVTSPILYETLILEDPLKTPWTESKRNPGWQYTK
jgi:hypothetical protein